MPAKFLAFSTVAALIAAPNVGFDAGSAQTRERAEPHAVYSPAPLTRVLDNGVARGYRVRTKRSAAATLYVSESFAASATTPGAWTYGDNTCLTAGTSATPATSVPACGLNAPAASSGLGAAQLTPPVNYADGFLFYKGALPTGNGLSIAFDYYSYNSAHGKGGDGTALVLTDGRQPLPTTIGGCCGSLGYATHNGSAALKAAYLGVGLDESGYFTAANEGKTGGTSGLLPQTITVRGAAQTNEAYLFGVKNASGQPARLPFALGAPTAKNRPAALIFNITLSASGFLSVTVDRQNGQGPVTYVPPTQFAGVAGQPSLPPSLYFGFIGAGGGANARHQISNVSVSSVSSAPPPPPKTQVTTYHNDALRTGWNPNEATLTTSNVNSSTFGLLKSVALDGRVDAQPLVVPNQPIDGQGLHDVVYVATENDTLYAVDAQTGAILKARNFGTSIPNTAKDYDDNVYPVYGILSTPVIDLARGALYVVTDTNEGAAVPDVYRLHEVALNNLADLSPSVVMTPGTTLSDGSPYAFAAQHERQRPALLEANGTIYVAFGSTGDTQPAISRGVIGGFSAATLAPLASNDYTNRLREATNPFYLSSIWQSGYGPAADPQGNVYFSTGNSDGGRPSYDPTYNFPDSVLKISGDLSRRIDSFTQYTYFAQDQGDGDFGSGGTMLLPDQNGAYPHLVVAGGKDGKAYVLNRDSLGGYTPNGPNKDLAELSMGSCWCGPAYFVGADGIARIVTGGGNGVRTWKVQETPALALAADSQVSASLTNGQPDNGGTIPAVSSNGTASGSAIVWFVQRPNETSTYTMTLRAFDAANLSHQLFAGAAGSWTNFNSNADAVPTVANGRVYVGSYKQLQIFGLLGQ